MDTPALLRIVNGEDQRLRARLGRLFLKMLVPIYWVGITLRNRRFDRGHKVVRVDRPVISVGNITTGGTGKTPFVMWLLECLQTASKKPVLLSRGYARKRLPKNVSRSEQATYENQKNDEGREIELLFPEVIHHQNPDRVCAAKQSIAADQPDLFVLDDGFQHRRLARDLDIVLIDATCPFGFGRLLPAGLLREPLSSLVRADIIVLTRCEQVSPDRIQEIRGNIEKCLGSEVSIPVFQMKTRVKGFDDFDGQRCLTESLEGKRAVAFCGVGNPRSFAFQLESTGLEIVRFVAFPDHHEYSPTDFENLAGYAEIANADMLVCTQKDRVKIDGWQSAKPVLTMQIEIEIDRPQQLAEQILALL